MTTFQLARLKLTAWYLLIIMFISMLFSIAIYNNVSRQIEGFIRVQNERIRNFQSRPLSGNFLPYPAPPQISTLELQNELNDFAFSLLFINLVIFIVAGGSGYFLAGRTLAPIKLMVDEQNQFISDASHELRTPIATLRAEMESELMEKKITDKQARKLISSNLEDLSILQNLVNNLLNITKIHNIDAKKESISLLEILKYSRDKVAPLAKKKNIDISIDLTEVILKGNKTSLIELFVILFDNAIKYSPLKSQIIVVMENFDNEVRVLVKDQGQGIAKTDLPHIFERFYRADKSRSQDGYGLGLSIAKKIVEEHRGTIQVASAVNRGSVFTITLPRN